MSAGLRLKSIRRARGITQPELAAMIGVSARMVRYWEIGARDLRHHLPEIAEALGITESEFLDYDGPIPPHNRKLGGGGGS